MTDDDSKAPNPDPQAPTAPNPVLSPVEGMRTFTLNSPEAYEILCPRDEQPWIMNGSLPREPRVWEREVLSERDCPPSK